MAEAAPLLGARSTSEVSCEAPSTTFVDRLEVFPGVIDLGNTLEAFVQHLLDVQYLQQHM